jgi:hypothetical protein
MLPLKLGKDYVDFIKPYEVMHHDMLINEVRDIEKEIYEFFGIFIVDRTQTFKQGSTYKIVEPIPEGGVQKTFAQLVDERAEEIKEKYKDRPLVLMWSGGLDSTTALYALNSVDCPMIMHINHHAVGEYPLLAAEILSGKYKNIHAKYVHTGFLGSHKMGIPDARHPAEFDYRGWLDTCDDVIVITGEVGDQVFGSAVSYPHSFKTRQDFYRKRVPENIANELQCIIESFLNKPEHRISFGEWTWAINFTCKYQNVLLRMGALWRLSPLLGNCDHFFNTKEFQLWSMQNFEKNASYQSQFVYKQPMREYIVSKGGDRNWAMYKRKIGSLCQVQYL